MEEHQYSIPAMSTTNNLSSLHPQQYFQYYSSTTNNFSSLHPQHQYFQYYSSAADKYYSSAADNQMSDINYGGPMSHNHQDPRVQGHQHNSSTLDHVDVDYEVRNYEEDDDYESLAALINSHVKNKEEEEEIVQWKAAADVSSWEWPRDGGTLESIIDQTPCLAPLTTHVPDHGVHDHGNEVEEEEEDNEDQILLLEDQEYCLMVAQVLAEMENTVVQSKHSTCNTEWMTVDEGDGHNSTPPPSYHSQGKARKITENRQMKRGKSSTAISSSSNKRSKATILHNKSERKRRSKINDRLETLQKLLPNFNKTDKASMLDQVIEYVKKLQTQNDQMMNMRLRNNTMPVGVHPMMMMPHYITTTQAMQQQQQQQQQQYHQQQMYMMAQMGMGMSTYDTSGPGYDVHRLRRASEHETGMSIYAATRTI